MKEIPLKQWITEQAQREGRTVGAVTNRMARGKYPRLRLRRVNARVVFVQPECIPPMHSKT